jgi:hypothetical protein
MSGGDRAAGTGGSSSSHRTGFDRPENVSAAEMMRFQTFLDMLERDHKSF